MGRARFVLVLAWMMSLAGAAVGHAGEEDHHRTSLPRITSVRVDLPQKHLIILGRHIGRDPVHVRLGEHELRVLSVRSEEILAELPADIDPGGYRLTLWRGGLLDTFDLTIGAVGPQGPPGPPASPVACVNGDGACPAGCNANNDNDCTPVCGNGVVEQPETCDPLARCPTSCPSRGCQLFTLTNPGTCQAACVAAGAQNLCVNDDGCCPVGCSGFNDNDCSSSCGNNIIEPPETCDPPGSCPSCAEPVTCYASTGSAANCDVACHLPVTICGVGGDACCPFDGGGGCSSGTDPECAGPGWRSVRFPVDVVYSGLAQCATLRVFGIQAGGSYLFTTCSPAGAARGIGDPAITQIKDDIGNDYTSFGNDNCGDATALPRLAGWSCENTSGQLRMACSPQNPGGFIVKGSPRFLDLTICPANAAGAGTAPVYIWFNAAIAPNGG